MFATLNNILGISQPRHAEQNDTRQDIQRHDPEFERKKKNKQKREDDLFADSDNATVSIDALQTFLNTFLKELSSQEQTSKINKAETPAPTPTQEPTAHKPKHQKSGQAAYAANTYQHIAESRHQTSILGDVNEENADLISLGAADIRIIHSLLEDLKTLSKKNIEYIRIERADNFLQSLVNAVNTLKKSELFKA